ncbi:MAG: Tn3 family transposase [Pseudonocardiaceae bacterium]
MNEALPGLGWLEIADRCTGAFERLRLLVCAYCANTGIRSVVAGDYPRSEEVLWYARRRYFTLAASHEVAQVISNVTFAVRQSWLWGEGTTAVASDSAHFFAFDQSMRVDFNYADSYGASFIRFGITLLLGFDVIARFKQINKMSSVYDLDRTAKGHRRRACRRGPDTRVLSRRRGQLSGTS